MSATATERIRTRRRADRRARWTSSARQVRTGIRSSSALLRELRLQAIAPIPPDTPRSPQRPGLEASLRRYFDSGRDAAVLLADFQKRTQGWKRRDAAASEIANALRMLERFAVLDRRWPNPTRVLMKPVKADVLGHVLSMGADLLYELPEGWMVRQILTDLEIRRTEHMRMTGAASAIHFEGRVYGGPVSRVEICHLRFDDRVVGWPRSLLERTSATLATRLDEIAAGVSNQAA